MDCVENRCSFFGSIAACSRGMVDTLKNLRVRVLMYFTEEGKSGSVFKVNQDCSACQGKKSRMTSKPGSS